MSNRAALFVTQNELGFRGLKRTLDQLGIDTVLADSLEQSRIVLEQPNPPELVFTDATLSDGNWSGVIRLASKAQESVHVVVVYETADCKLYLSVKRGAAVDLLLPPFSVANVSAVIRKATVG